jgi:hypothetical protein
MRVLSPPKAPPLRRGALGRCERSPVLCATFGQAFNDATDGERHSDGSLDGKCSPEANDWSPEFWRVFQSLKFFWRTKFEIPPSPPASPLFFQDA